MIARAVNAAADVIHRAQANGAVTAAGIAVALESAQLLASPELVHESAKVEAERDSLKARVAELEQQLLALRAQGELLRASHFTEAARLLEDTGKDDDAVNLLDIVASGIRVQAVEGEHYASTHHSYRLGRDLPPVGGV